MKHGKMEPERPDEKEENTSQLETDWDNRVLCSDGNCIGVIGTDGRCKECGKKYEGASPEGDFIEKEPFHAVDESRKDAEFSEAGAGESSAGVGESPSGMDETPPEENETFSDDDWENRKLCSDGNCIGVIGSDGRCNECGKPHEG